MPTPEEVNSYPVAAVAVVVSYMTKNGESEVVHTIDGAAVKIISCNHSIERKVKATRDPDTKDMGDPEPTGEETLTLKVKYIRKV